MVAFHHPPCLLLEPQNFGFVLYWMGDSQSSLRLPTDGEKCYVVLKLVNILLFHNRFLNEDLCNDILVKKISNLGFVPELAKRDPPSMEVWVMALPPKLKSGIGSNKES